MADRPSLLSLDPFNYWRDLVSQIEKGVNEFAAKNMTSDEFASGMNKVLGASMATKKIRQDLAQRYLEAFNLPSRADVQALTEKLQAVEDRMIGMALAVERMERAVRGAGIGLRAGALETSLTLGVDPVNPVRRTRKPPELAAPQSAALSSLTSSSSSPPPVLASPAKSSGAAPAPKSASRTAPAHKRASAAGKKVRA